MLKQPHETIKDTISKVTRNKQIPGTNERHNSNTSTQKEVTGLKLKITDLSFTSLLKLSNALSEIELLHPFRNQPHR